MDWVHKILKLLPFCFFLSFCLWEDGGGGEGEVEGVEGEVEWRWHSSNRNCGWFCNRGDTAYCGGNGFV